MILVEEASETVRATIECIQQLGDEYKRKDQTGNEEQDKGLAKVIRALDSLRRVAVRCLEGERRCSAYLTEALKSMLDLSVQVFTCALQEVRVF
jgi:hypothetical protein